MRNLGSRISKCESDNDRSKSAIRNPHLAITILVLLLIAGGCKSVIERQDVRPRVLRDVPARNLAYRLSPDVSPPSPNTRRSVRQVWPRSQTTSPPNAKTMRYCELSSLPMDGECLRFTAPRMNRAPSFASISYNSDGRVSAQSDTARSFLRVSGNCYVVARWKLHQLHRAQACDAESDSDSARHEPEPDPAAVARPFAFHCAVVSSSCEFQHRTDLHLQSRRLRSEATHFA